MMNTDEQLKADLLIARACDYLQELERDHVEHSDRPMGPKHAELLILINQLDTFRRRDEIAADDAQKIADGLSEHEITELPNSVWPSD